MADKSGQSDKQAGFRIPSDTVEALMRYRATFASKTAVYMAAFHFYLEAAEQYGVDGNMRPKVTLRPARDGPADSGSSTKRTKAL